MSSVFRFLLAALAAAPLMAGSAAASDGSAGTVRYLALGDSYTIGEAVPSDRRWPVLLYNELRVRGVRIEEPVVVAKTGWTTDELWRAMDERGLEPAYGLVTLLIGVNDQYRGRDVAQFRQGFEALLERAIRLAGGRRDRVLVVSIPDWGVTPFATRDERGPRRIGAEIDDYNEAKRAITDSHGVRFVDITDLSRRADDDASLVADDGLHPSAAQYELWMQRILPAARSVLSSGE